MRNIKSVMACLALSFAILMSVPFLVPHTGFLALIGFVPLLLMDVVADSHGIRRFFWWYYLAFVLWNAFTTFWVCNATVGGGIFAVVANAAQMALIFAVFRMSKKKFTGILPYIFLAAMWIAWERFYLTSAQISWPWLVLGNSFARSIGAIQWYEYTGTLGGSLWVWTTNISLFLILKSLMQGTFGTLNAKAAFASLTACVLSFLAPFIISGVILHNYEEDTTRQMPVYISQPNFDPYEKFTALSQSQQNVIMLDLMSDALRDYAPGDYPALLLTPETFTYDIIVGQYESSPTWQRFQSYLRDYPGCNILFGASSHTLTRSSERPSVTARPLRDGGWRESHNSALITDATGRTQIFHKSKLVVGTELTPFPRILCRLDDMLGGVMGRCVGQEEVTVLDCCSYDAQGAVAKTVPVGSVICYESVYGEYCTDYVRKGAQALVVITNDAWWGNTPGYRQHLSYSSLRAIETRRDIARCANTGISCFIDQTGRICQASDWWEAQYLKGSVNLNDSQTFFVRHGDVPGRIAVFVFLLLSFALLVRFLGGRK